MNLAIVYYVMFMTFMANNNTYNTWLNSCCSLITSSLQNERTLSKMLILFYMKLQQILFEHNLVIGLIIITQRLQ